MPPLHEKHFTLEQARKLLPTVRKLVENMIRLKRDCDKQGFQIGSAQTQEGVSANGNGKNGSHPHPKSYQDLIAAADELNRRGIQLKDLEAGLIDFPHLREDGEEIYLCWRLGEEDIEYWHRIEDGFAGRRPIEDL